MKRTACVFIFVICLSFPVFSAEAEGASSLPAASQITYIKVREPILAIGFDYGFLRGSFFDGTQDVKTRRTSPTIQLDAYSFPVHGVDVLGFFVHGFLLGIPNRGYVDVAQPAVSDFFGAQVGFMAGFLRKYSFNEKFSWFYGMGPSFFFTSDDYTQHVPSISTDVSFTRDILDLGIGVTWGFKWAIGNHLRLFAGVILHANLLSLVALNPSDPVYNDDYRIRDFSLLKGGSIRPYISIGYSL
jgi:hypothetical protein